MRALIQQTYQQNRTTIFRQIAAIQPGVGENVFLTQDYSTGIPVVGCQLLLAHDFVTRTDLEVQQVYYGARAKGPPHPAAPCLIPRPAVTNFCDAVVGCMTDSRNGRGTRGIWMGYPMPCLV
jgi:hypothetical protein